HRDLHSCPTRRSSDLLRAGDRRQPRRRPPRRPGVRPRDGRAAEGRHRLRLLRRRRPAPALHVGLLRRQVGPGGAGHRAADGTGGHRRPRLHHPARAHVDRHGRRLGRRRRRVRPRTLGPLRPRPAPALPQGQGARRRDRRDRRRAPRRAPQPARRQPRSSRGGRVMTPARPQPLDAIPEVSMVLDDRSPGVPEIIRGTGHLPELRTDPIGLLHRVRDECGDVGRFRLADKNVVLVSGAEANEAFFRAPDEVLDQAAAYPFMTPIFGEGVVFDASPEERQQMLRNQALRGDMMRGHAQTIEAEIRRMVAGWGDEGEIDLLDFFAELTIYTTSACLIGKPFREELDSSFARHYHDLERGTDAIAYVDAYADIESFRLRDAARERLVGLVGGIIDRRKARGKVPREERDLLDVLISLDMSADHITGIFISMMFAGHHTSSGTASWAMIELLRHPDVMA